MSDPAADSRPIDLRPGGLPSTVLPPVDAALADELRRAAESPEEARHHRVSEVVAAHPRFLDAWATLGDLGRDPVERYAAYRVGYHRGLDALRANGWRGSGYVRWSEPSNHGFLRALAGLGQARGVRRRHDRRPCGIGDRRRFLAAAEAQHAGQILDGLGPGIHPGAVGGAARTETDRGRDEHSRAPEFRVQRTHPQGIPTSFRPVPGHRRRNLVRKTGENPTEKRNA